MSLFKCVKDLSINPFLVAPKLSIILVLIRVGTSLIKV